MSAKAFDSMEPHLQDATFVINQPIEMTPLWTLTPTLFTNIEDPSALLQVVTRNNLAENMEFIGALNLPLGPDGSEYGGIALNMPDLYLSADASLFAQLAWYF